MSSRQQSLRSTQTISSSIGYKENHKNSSRLKTNPTAEHKRAGKSPKRRKSAKIASSSVSAKVSKLRSKLEPQDKSHRQQTTRPANEPRQGQSTPIDPDETTAYFPPEPSVYHDSEAQSRPASKKTDKLSRTVNATQAGPQTDPNRDQDSSAMSHYLSSEAMRVRLATASDVTLDEILCEAFHSNNDTLSVRVPGLSTNRLGAYMLFVSRIYHRRGIKLREQEREEIWRACFPEDFDELALQMTAFVIYTFRDIFKHVHAVEGFEQASRRERIEVATMCTRAFWDAVLEYVELAYAKFGQHPPDTFALTARMERVVNDTILRSPGVTVDL